MSTSPASHVSASSQVRSVNPYVHPEGSARGWWTEEGIVYVQLGATKHRDGAPFTEADALNTLEVVDHLTSEHESFVQLVDIRTLRRTTAKSRRINPSAKSRRIAMLVRSRVSRMLGNAYLGINRNIPCPMRLFTNEEKALRWLMLPNDS